MGIWETAFHEVFNGQFHAVSEEETTAQRIIGILCSVTGEVKDIGLREFVDDVLDCSMDAFEIWLRCAAKIKEVFEGLNARPNQCAIAASLRRSKVFGCNYC